MLQNDKFIANMNIVAEQMDPFSLQELRKLLNPRVNRRVRTTRVVATGYGNVINDNAPEGYLPLENPEQYENLLAFVDFFKDGWSAFGTMSRNENGNVVVMCHTEWSREYP